MISVLLLQDLIAIAALLFLQGFAERTAPLHQLILVGVGFPIILIVAYVFQRYILSYLLKTLDKIH